jgi:hypothetical protein
LAAVDMVFMLISYQWMAEALAANGLMILGLMISLF